MNKKYAFAPLAILIALACSCPVALPNTTEIQSTPTTDLQATTASVDATTAALEATVAAVEAATPTQAPPTTSPSPEPTSSDIPFQEDFSKLNRDWWLGEDEYGDIFLTNNELHIINYTSSDFVNYTFPKIDVADVVIDVESYLIGGTDNNWISISCRFSHDSFDEYLAAYSSDGFFTAYAYIDGERDSFVEITASSAINQGIGAMNHVQLECNGDHIRFWVNDVLLVDAQDDRLSSGDITLGVNAIDGEFSEVSFDNLQAMEP